MKQCFPEPDLIIDCRWDGDTCYFTPHFPLPVTEVEVVDEGLDTKYSPLRRPVHWRIER